MKNTTKKFRKAFTLIELLIVIAIIAILTGVTIRLFGSSTESAQAAKCMANMRSLAVASQNYLMIHDQYPRAGSFEYVNVNGGAGGGITYNEAKGWISWRRASTGQTSESGSRLGGTYILFDQGSDGDVNAQNLYAITNGALWQHVKDLRCYTCPVHAAKCKKHNSSKRYAWSYVMNSYFKCDKEGKLFSDGNGIHFGSIGAPERMLLFAEMPAVSEMSQTAILESSGKEGDCVLNYEESECIGFNHLVGGKYVGHVAFADGHVAKMFAPIGGGLSIEDLTDELCSGRDVTFSGTAYEKVE